VTGSGSGGAAGIPEPPAVSREFFGDRVDDARRYAALLGTAGVERGLIGPREVERLWERHLLNCAAVAELLPPGAQIVDVGSGAGLPGIPLALARPELRVVLLEPMERRCIFLAEAVETLGLAQRVSVLRGRAPDAATLGGLSSDVVVARAVAPLGRLAGMLLPLVRPGGLLLALRGSRAVEELREASDEVSANGARDARVVRCGVGRLAEPTTVVLATRVEVPARQASRAGRREREAGRDQRARGRSRST
jgi:16S rRNA (guanine527-N7)-methyltransferase